MVRANARMEAAERLNSPALLGAEQDADIFYPLAELISPCLPTLPKPIRTIETILIGLSGLPVMPCHALSGVRAHSMCLSKLPPLHDLSQGQIGL